ncbi:hypothetical protein [Ralstonia sp. 24A2]|uniref:hypothetical protein n=1 Tax=Ralstonia sp. 24A2 TaxID=3447364 RepID=UPI003F695AC7
MSDIDLSRDEIERWRREATAADSISRVLRRISAFYRINKFEVASLVADIFEDEIAGEDMQVIWKWDIANAGGGFKDHEVDALLGHLLR